MRDTIEVTQRPTLLRLPAPHLAALRRLCRQTRVSQSTFLREAIADLLDKYAHVLARATGPQPDPAQES